MGIKETNNEDLWEFITTYMVPDKTFERIDDCSYEDHDQDNEDQDDVEEEEKNENNEDQDGNQRNKY